MATELAIAQGFQTLFRAMSEFEVGDVVINDDTLYDGEAINCPYVIIYTASDFELTPASSRTNSTMTIPVMHVEVFTTWSETYSNLRNTRQAIIDEVFTAGGMSANGLSGVMVTRIFNLSEIEGLSYEGGDGLTSPIYLQQSYGIEVQQF